MRSHRAPTVVQTNLLRILAVVSLVVADVVCTPSYAESPEPTVLVPEAISTDSAGTYGTLGFGQPGDSERLQGHGPAFAFTLGASFPIKGRAYVDVGMYFSMATYGAEPSLTAWGNDATLRTFAITASGRFGHTGKKVAIFGSAGVGLAFVSLGGAELYGIYTAPVDKTVVPALTAAGSLEAPAQKHNRFLAELRYSWISVDFGSNTGGSLNAGGPALLLGWKVVF